MTSPDTIDPGLGYTAVEAVLAAIDAAPAAFAHMPDHQWISLICALVETERLSPRDACVATAARDQHHPRTR